MAVQTGGRVKPTVQKQIIYSALSVVLFKLTFCPASTQHWLICTGV